MQNAKVIPFDFESHEVRTLLIDDQPWFVASDVAKALNYLTAKDMARNLDDDERGRQIVPTPSGNQEMTVINESGLYSAILRSRKAEAKRFKKWVTAEVLPAIRKHGFYADSDRKMSTLLGQTIGTDGFRCLGAVLDGKLRHLPKPDRTRAKNHIWSQVHKAFSVVSAQDIPADKLDAVRNFIGSYAIEGEWIGKEQPSEPVMSEEDFAFLYALCADALSVVQTFEEIEPALKLLKSLALMNIPSSVNNFRVAVGRMHDRFGPQMERAAKKRQLYRDYMDMSAARDKSKPIYL